MNADSSLDWKALDSLVSRQLDAEVRAIVLAHRCGEGPTLSAHEKLALVRRASAHAKRRGSTFVVGALEATSTAQCVELCKLYQDAGADGILANIPLEFPFVGRGILSHFKMLALAVSIPVFIGFPDPCDPYLLSTPFFDELLSLPGVLGASLVGDVSGVSSSLKSQKLFLSSSETFFHSASFHCESQPTKEFFFGGLLSGVANIFPRECKDMWDHYSQLMAYQPSPKEQGLLSFAHSLDTYPLASATKGCLHQQNLIKPFLRLPYDSLAEDSLRDLSAELGKITRQLAEV